MTLQKPNKDKLPNQCPHCNGMNTEWEDYYDEVTDVMYCKDCDSTWFEYKDKWERVFQKGKVVKNED